MVPKAGLEPARTHRPLPPQDSVSANSTTSALIYFLSESLLSVKSLDVALGTFLGTVCFFFGTAGAEGIPFMVGVVGLWEIR